MRTRISRIPDTKPKQYPKIEVPEDMKENVTVINAYTRERKGEAFGSANLFFVPLENDDELHFIAVCGCDQYDIQIVKANGDRIPRRDSVGRKAGDAIKEFLDEHRTKK